MIDEIQPVKILAKCKADELRNKNAQRRDNYINRLFNVNCQIKLVGEYYNMKTPTLHECLDHNVLWFDLPTNIVDNKIGCPECTKERIKKTHDAQRFTHEKYLSMLQEVNPHIIPIEEYKGMNTSILHLCKIHNVSWKTSPNSALKSTGCPTCANILRSKIKSKTNDEYLEELNGIQSTIVPLEEYKGANTSISHKCTICGYIWNTIPSNILQGHGCPNCAGNAKRTHDEYIELLKINNDNLEVLEEYVNASTPILHICKKHNVEWKVTPYWALKGVGCVKCMIEKLIPQITKTTEQYIENLKQKNPFVVPHEEYLGMSIPIKHYCLIHNIEYTTTPACALQGCGCPECYQSHGEKQIMNWLNSHDIEYIPQYKYEDCRDKKPLPFDFYIPLYNLCIEYDGEQHFRPVDFFGGQKSYEKVQRHDAIKSQYCVTHNINLLRIRFDEDVEEVLNNYFTHLIQ